MKKRGLITYTNIHRDSLETIEDTIERFQDYLDLLNSISYHRGSLIKETTDQDLVDAGFDVSTDFEFSPTGADASIVRFIDKPIRR